MKKIIITSIFATLCLPTLLFADATITTSEQCLVKWAGVNVDTCSITSTNGGGTLLSGGSFDINGGSSQTVVGAFATEGDRVYTMKCKGYQGGSYQYLTPEAKGTCTVDNPVTAPTTASVSYNPTSGYMNTSFTITVGASGGDAPTVYKVRTILNGTCPDPDLDFYQTTFSSNATDQGWTPGSTYRTCVKACNSGGCSPVVYATYLVKKTPTVDVNFTSLKQLKEIIKNIISERNQPNVFLNALLGYTNHSSASLAYQRSSQ